jgi:hypothetical protein
MDPNKMTTTSITVADKDRAVLLAIYPEPSTLQVTLNIMLVKLISALQAKGLTAYDPESYVTAINELEVGWFTNHKPSVEDNPPVKRGKKQAEAVP